MPGILPMKVIKVGTTSQSRIAQACDRCRSKKIRCDGIRPCCSQCSNVGFECKTSDKLSRRAFPRGYTESLEERVRVLEGEVRELKDLLDEKDEKIDMLSKMHSNRRGSSSASSMPSMESRENSPSKEDVFRVQASPLTLGSENSNSFFMGASSGRVFVDAFKRKVQESGKSLSGYNADAFLTTQNDSDLPDEDFSRQASIPPRMFSDRCVNVFFQEWAPLFPVLHKSTFLHLYEDYSTNPEAITDNHKLAQLHLVFGIAGASSDNPDKDQIALCESQWRASLSSILMDNTITTIQCLILASLYCISKGDYKGLSLYKGIAVTSALRLGLHQSQKIFTFGALTAEIRKKVFWSLYTIDCFSAALLGLPQLLKKDDIHCEYPTDIDDEYVTEKGFLPTLPGESSKISSALALFRVSRILSRVLQRNYPAVASHELSLQSLSLLETELNEWSDKLPTHLKLTFVQDKPSTDITGNRSALLSLAYYYIRTLIHRPAVGSNLGSKASSSVISLAESSKHIIQIVQLLEERSMSFSFCLNKNEMLTLCGLSLLYQGLDLKQEGKLMKDGQRFIGFVAKYLEKFKAPGAADFKRLVTLMTPVEPRPTLTYRQSSEHKIRSSSSSGKPTSSPSFRKQVLQPSLSSKYSTIASASETDLLQQQEKLRRATLPNLVMQYSNNNRSSTSITSIPSNSHSDNHRRSNESHRSSTSSVSTHSHVPIASKHRTSSDKTTRPNLDYLSLSNTPAASGSESPSQSRTFHQAQTQSPTYSTPNSNSVLTPSSTTQQQTQPQVGKMSSVTPDEWACLLSSLDAGQSNIYDAVYGGPSSLALHQVPSNTSTTSIGSNDVYSHGHAHALPVPQSQSHSQSLVDASSNWSAESWDMTALSMHDFDLSLSLIPSANSDAFSNPRPAHSVLSFSEESLSSVSGDDLGSEFVGSGHASGNGSGRGSFDYNLEIPMAQERYMLEGVGLDGNYRL